MSSAIESREAALRSRLEQMRTNDEWHLFQNFVLGLLPHNGYQDVRWSAVRHDLGRDGVAVTPQGEPCFIAVSFDASLAKVQHDARRWGEDPNREPAKVMLFACASAPTEGSFSTWRAAVAKETGLDLRLFALETILKTASREGIWRETCARLGITGFRPGYRRISPYDGILVRRALRARPPEWLRQRVPLAEWAALGDILRDRLILGKPGSGKTTTILQQLELARPGNVLVVERDLQESGQIEGLLDDAADGAVIVFDDAQDKVEEFRDLCLALLARKDDDPIVARRYEDVRLLVGARSQEWYERRGELPTAALQDLGLLDGSELVLTVLDAEQCAELIGLCQAEWGLEIEPRLLRQAAEAAARRDATPLYVLSMLAAARGRDDHRLLDEHLAGLPGDVTSLWRRYWQKLPPAPQAILRLVKLFLAASVEATSALLARGAEAFGISPHELAAGLDALERSLWLFREGRVARCLDVQLEAIPLEEVTYESWDNFIFMPALGDRERLALLVGTGGYYFQVRSIQAATRRDLANALRSAERLCAAVGEHSFTRSDSGLEALAANNLSVVQGQLARLEATREGRRSWLERAVEAVGKSMRLFRDLGEQRELASALSNASNLYSELSGFEATREGRRGWLERALEHEEESVRIRRELGEQGGLASALSNASNRYSELSGLEVTRESRRGWLDRGVEAVEESVKLFRDLGVQGGLARSLNNASTLYAALAGLETVQMVRRTWLDLGVEAVKESVQIRRELGVRMDLAGGLNNAAIHYWELSRLEVQREDRRGWLEPAVEAVEEAVSLYRDLGVQEDLARSLNNASTLYGDLSGLETTREGRRGWLELAVKAVEESVQLWRALGVQGDLAMALGSVARTYRMVADGEAAPARATWLLRSLKAIREALPIFREVGERSFYLALLRENVVTLRLLAAEGEVIDLSDLGYLREEGIRVSETLGGADEMADFFRSIPADRGSGQL